MLEKIIIFILFLCPLIFFHELGHFIFARLFGVRVETFSIGFGPKLARFVRGGTEYVISLIPLGGYIKMFGDDPLNEQELTPEEKKVAFNHKSKWARFWIVFGGPLFNFVLAYVIIFALLMVGEKVPEAKFGQVNLSTVFNQKGINSGDILTKVNETPIVGLMDLGFDENEMIKTIEIERSGTKSTLSINLTFKTFMEEFIKYPPRFRKPIVIDIRGNVYGVSEKKGSISWDRSLEDIILTASPSLYLYKFKEALIGSDDTTKQSYDVDLNQEILIKIEDKEKNKNKDKDNDKNILKTFVDKGFYPLDLKVKSVLDGTPAKKAGIIVDDLIVALDGKNFLSFDELRESIQQFKVGKPAEISYYRNTTLHKIKLSPDLVQEDDKKVFKLGIQSAGEFLPLKFINTRPKNLIDAFPLALERTWDAFIKTVDGLKKLIFQEVSFKQVGGPIAIGKVASDSFNIGLSYFFKIMAIISVNLAVINLFPIPVLDGGHILFIFFEIINRGPLSRKKMEMAQRFGVSLLLLLIFASLFNDIARLVKF
ncbi:MAG: RIP metalloprotease RseP [Oligoflexia bacterium]|nr:RIP metalloprotease RseP [Oligoflexia bacterium]